MSRGYRESSVEGELPETGDLGVDVYGQHGRLDKYTISPEQLDRMLETEFTSGSLVRRVEVWDCEHYGESFTARYERVTEADS